MRSLVRRLLGRDLASHSASQIDSISNAVETILQLNQRSYQLHRESFVGWLLQQPRYLDRQRLHQSEFRVFSQSGQDGIIEEIFRRVGTGNRVFVEFGVAAGGGFENNTTYLLAKGWSGHWIDADPAGAERIQRQMGTFIQRGNLKFLGDRVTAENIGPLFERFGVPEEFDVLSIDIDSNDYQVWNALRRYRPRLVVIEYNPFFPSSANWVRPYDANRAWEPMAMEFGASLKAFETLGRELGYSLVGCDITGSDAFFVRSDLVGDKFCQPFTTENHFEPMRYHLIQPWGYKRELTSTFGTIQSDSDRR